MKKPNEIIENLYMIEEEPLLHDTKTTKITVRVPFDVAGLFTCLANRFDVNRFDLTEPVLIEAANQMFQSLSPKDRDLVAKLADNEASSLMRKAGIKVTDWDTHEEKDPFSVTWARAAKMIDLDTKFREEDSQEEDSK
jgi:transcriptional regulator of met regulon